MRRPSLGCFRVWLKLARSVGCQTATRAWINLFYNPFLSLDCCMCVQDNTCKTLAMVAADFQVSIDIAFLAQVKRCDAQVQSERCRTPAQPVFSPRLCMS